MYNNNSLGYVGKQLSQTSQAEMEKVHIAEKFSKLNKLT